MWNYYIRITYVFFLTSIMPRQSERQKLLQTLKSAKLDLQLAQYFDLVQAALHMIDRSDSDSASDSDSDNMLPSQSPVTSMSSISSNIITDLESLLATSEGTPYLTLGRTFLEFESLITALHDEVEKSCYLADRSWTRPPRAPQLQLLEEWSLEGDIPGSAENFMLSLRSLQGSSSALRVIQFF